MSKKSYFEELTGRIYKVLPLLEENPSNCLKYLDSLTLELKGAVKNYEHNYVTRILFSLEGIKDTTDYNVCRAKILECTNLCNKLMEIYKNE